MLWLLLLLGVTEGSELRFDLREITAEDARHDEVSSGCSVWALATLSLVVGDDGGAAGRGDVVWWRLDVRRWR